jgi:hypothetical protein
MGMKIEIEEALMAHAAWRKRIMDFLNGKAPFDLASAGDGHQCQFGKWFDNEGYRLMPEKRRTEIQKTHDEFHRVAAEIIQKIKEERFADAHADIASDGALNQASAHLTELLTKARLHEPGATPAHQSSESQSAAPGAGVPPAPPTGTPTPDKAQESRDK